MYSGRPSKNSYAEAEQFRRRAVLGFICVTLAVLCLAGWYFKLQVLDHAAYATRSDANRIKPNPVVPARGMIYDRKGRLLAENVPAFRLEITPDKVKDMGATLAELSELISLSPDEIERFRNEVKATSGFRPVPLKLRMNDEEMARFAVNRWRFPGAELKPYLTRRYPYGDLLAHIVGYVGRIDEKDLASLGEGSAALTHIGKTGVERSYEETLRGKVGYERIEINVEGRALRTLGRVPARPGADLQLSIDVDLQRAMVAAFGGYEGSAIAIDPRTGEILAMVSLPSFDPNLFVNGISQREFDELNNNPSRPQYNRIVLGGVAPGSTIKPFMALAGLDSGVRRPEDRTLSTGMFYLPGQNRGWGDSHRGGHGWTDARKSIYASVNTYYYQLGLDMGIARVDEYLGRYGFGHPVGIDLVGENAGILPSPEWKMTNRKERWYPGDTVNMSIGQGDWKVTPLQLGQGVAALANNGRLHGPHLARARRDRFDGPWVPLAQPAARVISNRTDHLQVVREGMIATVHGSGGTARRMGIGAPYLIAGKTGTAQVISRRGAAALNPRSLPLHLRHRALFIGYAPAGNPAIAVAIAVEGGGYGGSAAAPIARQIFDAYLLGRMPAGLEPLEGDESVLDSDEESQDSPMQCAEGAENCAPGNPAQTATRVADAASMQAAADGGAPPVPQPAPSTAMPAMMSREPQGPGR
ncbi:MAG: penicillin-binding protein 2 [Xanthomonadaceae bacterium]|jgi:penicillin-binding protein 2|nr:penicillin-binding protein 2 [Xanthomonadaceae bacterium]